MITLENIQTRLIQAIRESALKQKDIAKQLNVDPSNISHYVNGDILPSLDTFANLCKIIDADPAYILCLSDR